MPWLWQDLSLFAKGEQQLGPVIGSAMLPNYTFTPPFSVFMTRATWDRAESALGKRYPGIRLRNVTPDGSHVVLEVSS